MRRRLDAADLGPPAVPLGTTLTLSMALHLLGFALVIGLPKLLPRPAFAPVYVVDLVSLPGGPAAASSPPAAAPQPAAAPAPRREEKAIKIPEPRRTKPEPKKTPAPKKTPEAKPSPAPSATAPGQAPDRPTSADRSAAPDRPAPPAAETGVPGGTGAAGGGFGGSGAAAADALTFYASLVRRNIENAWKKPIYPPSETGRRAFTTQIRLTLTSSGRVANVQVLVPSGYEAMDRSVLAAVNEAMFPPFPSSLSYASLPFPVEIVLTPD
ncbi:MAG: TonB family protein [Acidobacteria bacterium]|nr:TonB family protein [Acidobacteriota bacterium]